MGSGLMPKCKSFDDASGEALGASLMQGEKELREMHPVAYASQKLSDLEKKYTATERECLGVLWTLKYFRHYV
ncbi:Retrovirus-related Pol polyprotein from transposon 297 [Eumeta japonica]|uniref:Retrovirus-related Pol polyprotein from transposon 297 n=1 Tax=Eumeta variegata TaxID=151549 RepID=A0A4C1U8Y0_EUMVA|nr:Retrovirus-related Pol polyprotein from transposon 297 [Eumeta japonica]